MALPITPSKLTPANGQGHVPWEVGLIENFDWWHEAIAFSIRNANFKDNHNFQLYTLHKTLQGISMFISSHFSRLSKYFLCTFDEVLFRLAEVNLIAMLSSVVRSKSRTTRPTILQALQQRRRMITQVTNPSRNLQLQK
jgi:hypothetical protein